MALHIPTVTIDDLRQYHAKHFPNAPLPEQYLHGMEAEDAEDAQEYYDDEDDGLGYYEDGVKRTLTDEQIAMFRHTEIQTILRERKRRLEEGEPLHRDTAPPLPSQTPGSPIKREPSASPTPSGEGTPMDISSNDEKAESVRVDKPKQQWTTISAKTRAKNARSRKKNRANHRARKKAEGKEWERRQRERERQIEEGEEQESDEWDPWHQANGPDVVKDETVDLDY